MNPDPTGLMFVISRNTIMGGIRELRPGGQEAAKKAAGPLVEKTCRNQARYPASGHGLRLSGSH